MVGCGTESLIHRYTFHKDVGVNRKKYETRHWVDENTGEENSEFRCPECGVWSHLIYYDVAEVIGFKCKNCKFEENANVHPPRRDEIH